MNTDQESHELRASSRPAPIEWGEQHRGEREIVNTEIDSSAGANMPIKRANRGGVAMRTFVDKEGHRHRTEWPIEAILDLFSPLPEDGYPEDIDERELEIERRYGLDVKDDE